jgi:hypothetical protein
MLEKLEGWVMRESADDGICIEISKGSLPAARAFGPFLPICRITEVSDRAADSSFWITPSPKRATPHLRKLR